jgi:hypothetical protein
VTCYLLDTSALIKRYHPEIGSQRVDELFETPEARRFIADLAVIELHSTLAKKVRTGEMDKRQFDHALAQFSNDYNERLFWVIRIGDALKEKAIQLLLKHAPSRALYTLDALHLAVAIGLQKERGPIHFITADERLGKIAKLEGIAVINPEKEEEPSD